MRRPSALLILPIALAALAGCGYHTLGAATHLPPDVKTLSVPVFATRTNSSRTEIVMTSAVIREFATRTRLRVTPSQSSDPDVTLHGTILTQTVAPLTYDSSTGQTSSYLVTITAKVLLTAHDGTTLYRNDSFLYHEQYQSTQDLSSFIQEDGYAVKRIARDFAQAVVSDMLESF
jgi:outer membrane lipopolysaccharide assembly protein LptE/RlpB